MSLDVVKKLMTAVEENNVDDYVIHFAPDAVYKIANFPEVNGPEGIRQFAAPVMQMFPKVVHKVKATWQVDDKVIAELEVTYTRKDGKDVTVPCLNVITFEGDKVKFYQAYIDVSPAFA